MGPLTYSLKSINPRLCLRRWIVRLHLTLIPILFRPHGRKAFEDIQTLPHYTSGQGLRKGFVHKVSYKVNGSKTQTLVSMMR